jgi:hypothetical protein
MPSFYTEKLIERCREELKLNLPEGTTIRRTKAGRHQKAAGAWSWYFWHPDHPHLINIGGYDTVKNLARAKKLVSWCDDYTRSIGWCPNLSNSSIYNKLQNTPSWMPNL